MPCCFDGLSARLISQHPASFNVTFMTGFGVAASLGYPDAGILSSTDNLQQAHAISSSLQNSLPSPLPCIADGDTGYGGPSSIRRTILNYGRAGMAGVMIEDQVSPKRCGHVDGKDVVDRDEAINRVRAACRARDEYESSYGTPGPLILARTDARGAERYGDKEGWEEAVERCKGFRKVGADITFMEAPRDVEEMRKYCREVEGPKLANMLEGGKTPILTREELEDMGFSLAAYPLTLVSAAMKAMDSVLSKIAKGEDCADSILEFKDVKDKVGFGDVKELDDVYRL
ncbi:hypothetical protein TrCOL_g6813 [Triparma columacea]|uniref:Carboxyvinyl-carboxyphosphonate phosphorylmutase n=1 Tax=Triparma columacea TaxID=722753 RepID=A0A9W7L2G2_9STRA|nr:hypothetical protein TrCOL_g6813 [Triparma columacea]